MQPKHLQPEAGAQAGVPAWKQQTQPIAGLDLARRIIRVKLCFLTARCLTAPLLAAPQRPSRPPPRPAVMLPGLRPALPHCSKAHIQGEVLLDFLRDTVEGVPDLPPAGSEQNKSSRQKRQR